MLWIICTGGRLGNILRLGQGMNRRNFQMMKGISKTHCLMSVSEKVLQSHNPTLALSSSPNIYAN